MKGNFYGYVRASADSGDTERQLMALWDFGVEPENVFLEEQGDGNSVKRQGKNIPETEREHGTQDRASGSAYQTLLKVLRENDTLVITDLDVLGNDCYELMDRWRYITIGKKAGIIVLELPLSNTGIEEEELGKVVARITLGVMQHFDQSRQYKRRRQAEGIARARQKGIPLGRKPKEIPREFESIRLRWDRGELSARSAADILGVDAGTFRKWVKAGAEGNQKYAETGAGKRGDG